MNQQQQAGAGISLSSAVFIVFLVLKLTGHIDWSWWWVVCPLWAIPAILLAALSVTGVVFLILATIGSLRKR